MTVIRPSSSIQVLQRSTWLLLGLVARWPECTSAQVVQGQVVDLVLGTPVVSGTVVLLDSSSVEVARATTDGQGVFLIRAPTAGVYSLRAGGSGYTDSEFPAFELNVDATLGFRLLVPSEEVPEDVPTLDGRLDEARIRQICQGGEDQGGGVVVGVVRDAVTRKPIDHAAIFVTWSAVPEALVGLVRSGAEDSQDVVASGTTGFYAVCGVPRDGRVELRAASDGYVSELVSLRFDSGGVYVGRKFVTTESRLFRQDFEVLPTDRLTASVSGTVMNSDGNSVPDVTIRIVGTDYQTRTNLFGRFELTGLPPGSMHVSAEAIGYMPTRTLVELAPDANFEVSATSLQLRPIPTQLAPIEVEAIGGGPRRNLSDFERRRGRGAGSFTTRAEFTADADPASTTDVLRKLPGISVRPGSGPRLPWIITSSRDPRGAASNQSAVCFPIVFVDEMFVGTTETFVVDNSMSIDQVEAIEFYGSVASVPQEFNRPGAACGALVFWTR